MNHLWRDGTLHSQKIFLYTVFWVWLLRTWVGSNRQLVNLVIKEFVDCNQQVDERNDWGGSATQLQEYSHVGFCWNHRLVKTWHILWCNFPFVLVLVLMLCFGCRHKKQLVVVMKASRFGFKCLFRLPHSRMETVWPLEKNRPFGLHQKRWKCLQLSLEKTKKKGFWHHIADENNSVAPKKKTPSFDHSYL